MIQKYMCLSVYVCVYVSNYIMYMHPYKNLSVCLLYLPEIKMSPKVLVPFSESGWLH